MADIATGVASVLLGSSAVAAAVGTRVYPQWSRMVDNAYPLAVYTVDGITPTGTYAASNALESCSLGVACIGMTYADAVATAQAVRSTLDYASGTWNGITVQGCFLTDDGISDEVVNEPESESILFYVRRLTFQLWFVNA